jgi:glucose-6-phosphate isomerase
LFEDLQAHAARIDKTSIVDLFAADPRRANTMQLGAAGGITLDYSKNCIDGQVLETFSKLFMSCNAPARLKDQLNGRSVNNTEQRPALHTAVRAALSNHPAPLQSQIEAEFQRAASFADSLHRGERLGHTGAIISDVVNIGIGGSDLGPRMACSALSSFAGAKVRVHFVSSLDSNELTTILNPLNPATTLFLVSSKSFSTEETLFNAGLAMQWAGEHSNADSSRAQFAAITGKPDQAAALGIKRECIFDVPDWIGGRYSLWSSSGLPLMIAIGSERFAQLLRGAWLMDQHAQDSDFGNNMPAILAALEVWHASIRGYSSRAVVPYSYHLRLLPAYLQQLVMESNGKSVSRDGTAVPQNTSPVLWGTAGTEGQHSYHQLLHQGTVIVPTDFILCLRIPGANAESLTRLASHCLAQSKALMEGKSAQQALQELLDKGMDEPEAMRLAPHKAMPGNRPSNTLVLPELNPMILGALIALYEHKTFFCSVFWDINPFDQWGVELGKQLSQAIYPAIKGTAPADFDASTNALVALFNNRQP